MADALLNPEELSYFRTARRRVQDTYGLGAAQNAYEQGAASNAYARSLGDLTRQFDQVRSKLPWNYAGRGMLNSGLYQKGLADYGQDRLRSFGNLRGSYEDQMGGFNLAAQQLAAVKTAGASDIEEQEQSRVASIAAMLRAVR